MSEQYRGQQERLDRRAALAAWVLASVNRDEKQRPQPFTLEEVAGWLGHGFQRQAPAVSSSEPLPPDALAARLSMLAEFYAGASNGQG